MEATLDHAALAIPETRAGFWRRLGAAIIDGIIVGIVEAIVAVAAGKAAGYVVGLVFGLAYFTFFHGRTGQTPGDAALGLKVIDFRGGTVQPIGYPRALLRWFVSLFSGFVIVLGYLWMLWDPEKQTWHDKAAGSIVVRTDDL
jgi:uncharacterized RDD family membrane protein YckC